jgi:hypothetical protein
MVSEFCLNITENLPEPGKKASNSTDYLFYNIEVNSGTFVFGDTNPANSLSVFTDRSINITYSCDAHEVTAGGNSTSSEIVADIGQVYVAQRIPS